MGEAEGATGLTSGRGGPAGFVSASRGAIRSEGRVSGLVEYEYDRNNAPGSERAAWSRRQGFEASYSCALPLAAIDAARASKQEPNPAPTANARASTPFLHELSEAVRKWGQAPGNTPLLLS